MKKDLVAQMAIAYYAQFPHLMREDILHTQEVVSCTRLIAGGAGGSGGEVEMQECAAWLHDIGCPQAKEIHGNSAPPHQMCEGRKVTQELLEPLDYFTAEQKTWLAEVVGTHHQHPKAVELGYLPLFEADLLVNILSGYYPREKAPHLSQTMLRTDTGKRLAQSLLGDTLLA